MLKFEPLTIDAKERFDSYVRGRGYMQSEASFANLFIWRNAWEIRIAEQDGALFVAFNSDTYRPFLIPPFLMDSERSVEPYMEMIEEYMYHDYGEFYVKCAVPDMVDKIKHDCGRRYRFRFDEANCDYVYKTSDLEQLAGKRYHGKRNHINAFLRSNYPAVADYAPKYRDACLELQEAWAKMRGGDGLEMREEYDSIRDALDYFDRLDLKGLVVLLDGRVSAFTLGEYLNEETALIHVEKAKPEINGLFTYINQQFVRRDWSHTKFINREEDMGIPGIRQAKRSYCPAFMVDKFDVIRSDGR